MITGLDHIGIAVRKLGEALPLYESVLGLKVSGVHELKEHGVRVAFLNVGETRIELLEPIDEESPIARFIKKRGEGIHHIALKVANIEAILRRLKERGIILVDEKPRAGAESMKIAFIHPKSTRNVLIELCET